MMGLFYPNEPMVTTDEIYARFCHRMRIATDSRHVEKGAIFFALKGDNFDGNQFALSAVENGACCAVVDDPGLPEHPQLLKVGNVLHALQQLANHHRKQMKATVIGITGSNGKTTSKELIAAVLSKKFNTLYTSGNLNNHIGVPLSLLRIKPGTEMAVIEMGANHQGEIAQLSRIAEPDFGLITNIGKAHLEGFGGLSGVINAKSELYAYIDDHGGKVFVSADNELLMTLSANINRFTYGQSNQSNVYGELVASDPFLAFVWDFQNKQSMVQTQLIGNYNFENLMAAVAVGCFFEVSPDAINEALATYKPQNSRSQLLTTTKNRVVMDAYNANPVSMAAAISSFDKICGKKSLLILGDMLELGAESDHEHAQILVLLTDLDFKNVLLVGPHFGHVFSGDDDWRHFPSTTQLVHFLQENQYKGYDILLKGSRGMQMEKCLPFL